MTHQCFMDLKMKLSPEEEFELQEDAFDEPHKFKAKIKVIGEVEVDFSARDVADALRKAEKGLFDNVFDNVRVNRSKVVSVVEREPDIEQMPLFPDIEEKKEIYEPTSPFEQPKASSQNHRQR